MIRRPPRSTLSSSSAASDVYKRQGTDHAGGARVDVKVDSRMSHACLPDAVLAIRRAADRGRRPDMAAMTSASGISSPSLIRRHVSGSGTPTGRRRLADFEPAWSAAPGHTVSARCANTASLRRGGFGASWTRRARSSAPGPVSYTHLTLPTKRIV